MANYLATLVKHIIQELSPNDGTTLGREERESNPVEHQEEGDKMIKLNAMLRCVLILMKLVKRYT
jgi:hypothetical protein